MRPCAALLALPLVLAAPLSALQSDLTDVTAPHASDGIRRQEAKDLARSLRLQDLFSHTEDPELSAPAEALFLSSEDQPISIPGPTLLQRLRHTVWPKRRPRISQFLDLLDMPIPSTKSDTESASLIDEEAMMAAQLEVPQGYTPHQHHHRRPCHHNTIVGTRGTWRLFGGERNDGLVIGLVVTFFFVVFLAEIWALAAKRRRHSRRREGLIRLSCRKSIASPPTSIRAEEAPFVVIVEKSPVS